MKKNYQILMGVVIVLFSQSCDPSFWDLPNENVFTNGTGTIGADGGVIKMEDETSPVYGVTVEVPEGAISGEIEISINSAEDFPLAALDPESFWIKMEPEGTRFEKYVKIGIPYGEKDPEKLAMTWFGDGDGGEAPFIELDKTNKIYYAGLDHFTYFGLSEVTGGRTIELVKDSRDEQYYLSRKIGKQWWFMNDAAYNVSGSRIYNDADSMLAKYGRLYNWEMAKKACPSGYHLPTREDWQELEMELGMTENEAKAVEGIRTKTSANVKGQLVNYGVLNYYNGSYSDKAGYAGNGDYVAYWTASESFGNLAWTYAMFHGPWYFRLFEDEKEESFISVKCVK